jgi:RNA polymerase sigma-70 factor (ECF subfamily)
MMASEHEEQNMVFDRLLHHARQGEGEALGALYRHFLPGIFGYIAARVPDRFVAEDLTSEVFLKMVEGIHQVKAREEAGVAAWLLGIARNTVAGYYRGQEKQPPLLSLTPVYEMSELHNYDGDAYALPTHHPEDDPVHVFEIRDEWQCVVQAMERLTEEQRQVLIGRLILGYDVATVAKMIGKKANAVKALQFRALQSLQRFLHPPTPDKKQTEGAKAPRRRKVSKQEKRS